MLQCVRGTCTEAATAGLGYDIVRTMAWIYDLDAATMAGARRNRDVVVPLCPMHADRIRVPLGWDFQDQRVAEPKPEPMPADITEPLFEPRSRPEPEALAEPLPQEQPSMLERAFRAAPVRGR
ncbi:DUF3499 family protein [Candidatus Poriferisodalis sp.]|uniref:DUF3499 family protein n=1 Tax=Candidatus Poriferisodalis sp. TaxID=3101277 RepID=UPI003B0225A6